MGRVVDRLFGWLIVGIFGLLLAGIILAWIERLLVRVLAGFNDSFFGFMVLFAITLLLVAGVLVRIKRAVTTPRGRTGREVSAEVRQTRQSPRRPAQDVPVESDRVLPEDEDPVIEHGEG